MRAPYCSGEVRVHLPLQTDLAIFRCLLNRPGFQYVGMTEIRGHIMHPGPLTIRSRFISMDDNVRKWLVPAMRSELADGKSAEKLWPIISVRIHGPFADVGTDKLPQMTVSDCALRPATFACSHPRTMGMRGLLPTDQPTSYGEV